MTDDDLTALVSYARTHTQLTRLGHDELVDALKTLQSRGLITLVAKPADRPAALEGE